jgi:hypothetical protein
MSGKPPDPATDPVLQWVVKRVKEIIAERCDVFGLDPNAEDFWRQLSYAFAFERLLIDCTPRPKRKTKPVKLDVDVGKRLIEDVEKFRVNGRTIDQAIKSYTRSNKCEPASKPASVKRRFYEAKKLVRNAGRNELAKLLVRREQEQEQQQRQQNSPPESAPGPLS